MLAVRASFPAGRYHACPWDRHVNEGVAEWPPSPYRLLRALVSSWKRTARDVPPEAVEGLISLLAGQPPEMCLPAHARAHKHHYVPTSQGRRSMIDAFVVCQGPVTWIWPEVQISEQLEPVLTRLISGVAYLGRAESLCSLSRDLAPAPANCRETQDSPELSRLARVLCLEPGITTEQLMLTSEQLRSRGALRPPSTRWRSYLLPSQQTPIQEKRPLLVTFLLQTKVPRQDTLRVADRVRRRLLTVASATSASETLLGKTGDRPRADGHQHLHVLPGGDPRLPYLQRVDLWAPEGFAAKDLLAIGGLTTLGPDKSGPPLRLLLWSVDDLSDMGLARRWRSYTPYLLARHPKSHGRDGPQEQLRRECQLRGWPEPVVNVVAGPDSEYQVRRGPRRGPPHPPVWMELLFPEPVQGPVCLGANAHFGMGRFLPLDAQEPDWLSC